MKNLFAENRLVFMNPPETPGGAAETPAEAKERLFNTDQLYKDFASYLGEGNNNAGEQFAKCQSVPCVRKHIKSWFKKHLGRLKVTGFKGSLSSSERSKYELALFKKLLPDLRRGRVQLQKDVDSANKEWVRKVEAENKSHGDILAKKIREIIKKYAPYTENVGATTSSQSDNPNLSKVKRGVANVLKQVARKFRISYTDLDIKGNGAVEIKAHLKKVITSNDPINKRRMEMITDKFSKEAKKKYPKAVV